MLEWYQAFSSLEELMVQTEQLLGWVAQQVCGSPSVQYAGKPLSFEGPLQRMRVAEAFRLYGGVDLEGVTASRVLRERAQKAGMGPFAENERFEEVASRVLVERVEPALQQGGQPVFLYDFPAPMAALSQLRADNPTVAERFELYAGGLELANAFGELTDPEEQLARLEEDQRARQQALRPVYDLDRRFLEALREGLPPTAGIALGVDRLLMLLTGIEDIAEVVAFAPGEI
jgi:lysyl-tRNA synthetase class 2